MHPRWLLAALRGLFAALTAVAPRAAGRLALHMFCTPRRHLKPGWERAIAAEGTPMRIGPGLAAWSWGSGPTILLTHGWEGRGTQLGRFVRPLVASGFRVLALDSPAHGESPGARTDLIECTEALRRVGRDLGPLAAVVAHSFGGAVATLALERGLDVRAVVLIAAPSSIEDVVRRFGDLIGLKGRGMAAFRTALERLTGVTLADVEIFERVATLTTPALIVHDRGDAEVPFHDAERLAARWPRAELLATEGLGHRRILRDDEVIGQVAEFVARQAGPAPAASCPEPSARGA